MSDIRIFFADVTDLADEALYRRAYRLCPQGRQKKADAYRFDKDKCLCVGAGVILRYAFSEIGEEFDKVSFFCTSSGKPGSDRACFSLSHSGTWVMCAISKKCELGCDLEKTDRGSLRIAERFFTDSETEWVRQDKNNFCRIWTLKESVMKCDGRGLGLNGKRFSVTPGENREVIMDGEKADMTTNEIPSPEGYAAAVCTKENEPGLINVKTISIAEYLRFVYNDIK